MSDAFDWLQPSPLWPAPTAARPAGFFRPQILTFQGDDFMEAFLREAAAPDPDALEARVALPPESDDDTPLKLFQPIHGAYYLVCASLCCRLPGFPDRVVRAADGESVFFLLRKLIDGAEYAWVPDDGWRPVTGSARRLIAGEERLPLLPAPACCGRGLLAGYLPVASQETYAVPPEDFPSEAQPDARIEELGSRFSAPVDEVAKLPADEAAPLAVSVYLFLELYEFMNTHLPDVAAAISANTPTATLPDDPDGAKAALLAFLESQKLGGSLTLFGALAGVAAKREQLNQPGADPGSLGFGSNYDLRGKTLDVGTLGKKVAAALPPEKPAIELPKLDTGTGARYALRCVYERAQCDPVVRVVSQASLPFALAPFFDPDAPARPVRIPLPTDVSVAGLRKFKPGVTFMMSNAMRKKVAQIDGKEKTLLGDDPSLNPEDSGGVAFICSFSIQIIFIVAFFLLLIFVIVLNFVFWWIAFFKICLPVPKRLLPE